MTDLYEDALDMCHRACCGDCGCEYTMTRNGNLWCSRECFVEEGRDEW